jgi:hypothetical protein
MQINVLIMYYAEFVKQHLINGEEEEKTSKQKIRDCFQWN